MSELEKDVRYSELAAVDCVGFDEKDESFFALLPFCFFLGGDLFID